jgi:hypothetical protein
MMIGSKTGGTIIMQETIIMMMETQAENGEQKKYKNK